ncbi:hypothetical protein [Lutimonas zeaxanthinifaciens]|uniref:hypothetical protein n=1 Tax=Lutimonas zeaxanthinifaciens TaxID=3060215 RepID=UPI00265CBDA3|nr:hypothetical protein [Lutimonas sp. YSD2104]WKK64888.1 hypothetical protein QZH61_09860 [Lutimonas sp. YSD2104]
MEKNISEHHEFIKKGQALSDLFSELEGRRPRIMIGSFSDSDNSSGYLKRIANSISDMGFDVDISPRIHSAKKFAMNALENDVDVLLTLTDSTAFLDEIVQIEPYLDDQKARILLLLFMHGIELSNIQKEMFKNWTLADVKTEVSKIGLLILNRLLARTG